MKLTCASISRDELAEAECGEECVPFLLRLLFGVLTNLSRFSNRVCHDGAKLVVGSFAVEMLQSVVEQTEINGGISADLDR